MVAIGSEHPDGGGREREEGDEHDAVGRVGEPAQPDAGTRGEHGQRHDQGGPTGEQHREGRAPGRVQLGRRDRGTASPRMPDDIASSTEVRVRLCRVRSSVATCPATASRVPASPAATSWGVVRRAMPPVASATATITSWPRATWARTWPRSTSGASAPISASVRGACEDSRLDEMPTHGSTLPSTTATTKTTVQTVVIDSPPTPPAAPITTIAAPTTAPAASTRRWRGSASAPRRPTTATAAPA